MLGATVYVTLSFICVDAHIIVVVSIVNIVLGVDDLFVLLLFIHKLLHLLE